MTESFFPDKKQSRTMNESLTCTRIEIIQNKAEKQKSYHPHHLHNPKHNSTPVFTEVEDSTSLDASPESTGHVVHQPIARMVQSGHAPKYFIGDFSAANASER